MLRSENVVKYLVCMVGLSADVANNTARHNCEYNKKVADSTTDLLELRANILDLILHANNLHNLTN